MSGDAFWRKLLGQIQPFKELAAPDFKRLLSKAVEKRFSKGETLFNEGGPAEHAWVLGSGRLQIKKYCSTGQAITVETLGPGELFGTLCRLNDPNPRYPCTAMAAEPGAALKIPDSEFMGSFRENASFTNGVCSLCVKRLKEFQNLLCFAEEPAPVKVAETLLRLRHEHGDAIPFTKREIAELCGIAVETAFRILGSFQKKRWLSNHYKTIRIQDPGGLASVASAKPEAA